MRTNNMLLTALSLLTVATAAPTSQPDPTATIDNGVLHGTQTALPSATETVNKFLGVPYAVSPPQRFSKPEPAKNFSAPFEAKKLPKACVQNFFYPKESQEFQKAIFNQPAFEESEDCLYLNVYAPSSPAPAEGRAVMFWIFGGGLQFGHGGLPEYDGSAFAALQDVVVVTHNYRTNLFGFPASPQLNETEQNLGFYDQRLALDWVRRNAAAFGGDPKKVTIFGESAGASSVDSMLTTYTTENAPFRGAIMQSSQNSYRYTVPPTDPSTPWKTLTMHVGCADKDDVLACMRALPATQLQNATEVNALLFQPVQDDVTYSKDPTAARKNGKFAQVPILMGTNANEGRTFTVGQTNIMTFLATTFAAVPKSIGSILQAFPIPFLAGPEAEFIAISDIATLYGFQCLIAMVTGDTRAHKIPTYRYYYDAQFPNLAYANNSGVYHSSEIAITWNTYSGGPVNAVTDGPSGLIRTNLQPTAQQKDLATFLNKAWADFAKDPAGGPGWKSEEESLGGVALLGALGSTGVSSMVSHPLLDLRCPLFAPQYRASNPGVEIVLGGL